MIFQHTIDAVLAGRKTQTSRLWKPDYVFSWSEYEEPNQVILSQKAWDKQQIRKLYYVGQELAVQPARGSKGVARIRVTELFRADVRDFTHEDIEREGFDSYKLFIDTWTSMHSAKLYKWCYQYPKNPQDIMELAWHDKPANYDALVIRFELVKESVSA